MTELATDISIEPPETSDAGVLLINLGTPQSPDPKDVRRYLDEFLMDGYVIRLPWPDGCW